MYFKYTEHANYLLNVEMQRQKATKYILCIYPNACLVSAILTTQESIKVRKGSN